jgi:hypothetical protein
LDSVRQSRFDEERLLKNVSRILDEKLGEKMENRASIEKDILEQMKTSMIEVWKEEAEKFYRNQSMMIGVRSECSEAS